MGLGYVEGSALNINDSNVIVRLELWSDSLFLDHSSSDAKLLTRTLPLLPSP